MVDKDTVQVLSDGFGKKSSRDGRVDSTAEAKKDLLVTDLAADLGNLVIDEGRSLPISFATTDIQNKILKSLLSFDGMSHFRMELSGIDVLFDVFKGCHRAVLGLGSDYESLRDFLDAVCMRHEDFRILMEAGKKPAFMDDFDIGLAIFARVGMDDLATKLMGNHLSTIADSKDRLSKGIDFLADQRRVLQITAVWTTGEDKPFDARVLQDIHADCIGNDFRINMTLADSSGNQLIVLSTEVDDENFVLLHARLLYFTCTIINESPTGIKEQIAFLWHD